MKPTVSQLLDLLNKPALMKWANKIGLDGIKLEDYQAEAKNKGTSLHTQIKEYLQFGIEFDDELTSINFKKFLEGKSILGSEVAIETENFIGRYDIKLEYSGKTYLCDFKSSKGIYLENILQLVAYSMAEDNTNVAIITLPDFKFKEIHLADQQPYIEILLALSNIHKNKQIINL